MKKKFALYALPVFAAAAILGVGFVSAHDTDGGGFMPGWLKFRWADKPNHEEIMDKKAEALGLTVEELETQMTEKKEHMLENKADMLGLTLEELQEATEAIEAGDMTWEEFLVDKGVDSEYLWALNIEKRLSQLERKLNLFVQRGKLSTADAEAKIDAMHEKFENKEYGEGHKHFKEGWFKEKGDSDE